MWAFLTGVLILYQMMNLFDAEPVEKDMVNVVNNTPAGVQYEQVRVRPLSDIKKQNVVSNRYDYSCGSAALTTILKNYLGVKINEKQAVNALLYYGEREKIFERGGFSLLDMKKFVTSIGYNGGGYEGSVEDLVSLEHPVIIPITYGGFHHFTVLKRTNGERAFLVDPALGNISMTLSKLEKVWPSKTIFMIKPNDIRNANMLSLSEKQLRFVNDDEIKRSALASISEYRVPFEYEAQTVIDNVYHIRP